MSENIRLINANILVGKDGLFGQRGCTGNCQHCDLWTEDGCRVILEAPTVEARPVVHGYWQLEYGSYGAMRCSVCLHECPLEKAPKPKYNREELLYIASDYCPHCGATMDGDLK